MSIRHNLCALLFVIISHFGYSQPATDLSLYKLGYPLKKDTVDYTIITDRFKNNENLTFNLGKLNIPLLKYNINNYNNISYCSMDELLENINGSIRLSKNGIPLYNCLVAINLYQYIETDQIKIKYSPLFSEDIRMLLEENTLIPAYLSDSILNHTDSLSILRFRFIDMNNNDIISTALLQAYGKDFSMNYHNELVYCHSGNSKRIVEVPIRLSRNIPGNTELSNDLYAYQVLTLKDSEILKIDTNDISTKTFLSYYMQKGNIDIIHLPGFKTRYRFENNTNILFHSDTSFNYTEISKLKKEDVLKAYEYNNPYDSLVNIKIGNIKSKDKKGYIDNKWFLDNIKYDLTIDIPEGEFIPYHFDIIIIDSMNNKQYISTNNLTQREVTDKLKSIPGMASVIIQNIFYIDQGGRKTMIPKSFGFNIIK